jgi:hypothetical protein
MLEPTSAGNAVPIATRDQSSRAITRKGEEGTRPCQQDGNPIQGHVRVPPKKGTRRRGQIGVALGKRTAESGNAVTFHFCPTCGSTVYWESEGFPGYVAVAIGNFADPNFPAPTIAVWEESRHPWVSLPPDTPPKRVAKQG